MKRHNRNRSRTVIAPIKISLSEAEILADLRYPFPAEQLVSTLPAEKRIHSR